MKRELVLIYWIDSAHRATWIEAEDAAEVVPVECRTVGFVVAETDDHITVVQSVSEDDGCDATMAIPKVCVRRRVTLRKQA